MDADSANQPSFGVEGSDLLPLVFFFFFVWVFIVSGTLFFSDVEFCHLILPWIAIKNIGEDS